MLMLKSRLVVDSVVVKALLLIPFAHREKTFEFNSAMQAPIASSSKRLSSRTSPLQSFREFTKFAKSYIGLLGGVSLGECGWAEVPRPQFVLGFGAGSRHRRNAVPRIHFTSSVR